MQKEFQALDVHDEKYGHATISHGQPQSLDYPYSRLTQVALMNIVTSS